MKKKTKKAETAAEKAERIKALLYNGIKAFQAGTRLAHHTWAFTMTQAISEMGWDEARFILVKSVGGKSATVTFFKRLVDAYAIAGDVRVWEALEMEDLFTLCEKVPPKKRKGVIKKLLTVAATKKDYGDVKGCIFREICREEGEFGAAEEGRCAGKGAGTKASAPQVSVPGPSAKQPKPFAPIHDPTDRLERNVLAAFVSNLMTDEDIGRMVEKRVLPAVRVVVENYRKETTASPVFMSVG